eukprot:TRINITY_DN36013_c0_g1_i1.p1 TRINITY_DN36013_c0_g1~~TRINITY_DN36013_c0_g1_i1.p1  ORF type:complete len:525 (-),score=94.83 TRINITY_DN36013_c0_g1_i1:169-1743(-)
MASCGAGAEVAPQLELPKMLSPGKKSTSRLDKSEKQLLKKCHNMYLAASRAGMDPIELGFDAVDDLVSQSRDMVNDMAEPLNVASLCLPASELNKRRQDAYARTLQRIHANADGENSRLRTDNDDLKAVLEKVRALEECILMCRGAMKAGKDPGELGLDYEELVREKEAIRNFFVSSSTSSCAATPIRARNAFIDGEFVPPTAADVVSRVAAKAAAAAVEGATPGAVVDDARFSELPPRSSAGRRLRPVLGEASSLSRVAAAAALSPASPSTISSDASIVSMGCMPMDSSTLTFGCPVSRGRSSPPSAASASAMNTPNNRNKILGVERRPPWVQLPSGGIRSSPTLMKADGYRQTADDVKARTKSECALLRAQNGELRTLVEKARALEETRVKCQKAGRDPADIGVDLEDLARQRVEVRRRVGNLVATPVVTPSGTPLQASTPLESVTPFATTPLRPSTPAVLLSRGGSRPITPSTGTGAHRPTTKPSLAWGGQQDEALTATLLQGAARLMTPTQIQPRRSKLR